MKIAKILKKLLLNTLAAVIILIIINFIGLYFNFNLALNIYSALIVGILGIPGLALLIFLKFMV